MKKSTFVVLALLLSLGVNAQKVKLKKDEVLLDGKAILKYEKESWGVHKIHLFSLDTEEELIEVNNNHNETREFFDDDFVQIRFLSTGQIVEMKVRKTFRKMIEWLLKKKIITPDGQVDESKLDLFVKNYDENITNRTVRY